MDDNEKKSRRRRKGRKRKEMGCPKHGADPPGHRKCKYWHNSSISAVSRHARKDANSEQLTQIKELSSMKLQAEERWYRYYCIFGGCLPRDQVDSRWTYAEDDEDLSESRDSTPCLEQHIAPRNGTHAASEPPGHHPIDHPARDRCWQNEERARDINNFPASTLLQISVVQADLPYKSAEASLSPTSYASTPPPYQHSMGFHKVENQPGPNLFPQTISSTSEPAGRDVQVPLWCHQPIQTNQLRSGIPAMPQHLTWPVNPTSHTQISAEFHHPSISPRSWVSNQTSQLSPGFGSLLPWGE